ncbi:MAG: hypothetical protein HC880_08930 [Bacteroidia bacterium]|nr:hypothetical protein [Bacteroidia bacterium]
MGFEEVKREAYVSALQEGYQDLMYLLKRNPAKPEGTQRIQIEKAGKAIVHEENRFFIVKKTRPRPGH